MRCESKIWICGTNPNFSGLSCRAQKNTFNALHMINKNPLFTKRCEQDFIKFNDIPQNIPSKRHIRLYLYLNWWNMTSFCIKFKRYYIWGVFLRFARKAPEVGILHGTWLRHFRSNNHQYTSTCILFVYKILHNCSEICIS